MKLPRRNFLHLAAGAVALPAVSRIARARTYPTRPVRIVVGLTAGSASDIIARLVGQWLSERLGQPFVIENRPGAGSNIAAEAVVRSPPDGYTLLLTASPNAINASLYEKLSFNFIRDIAPVAAISREPNVVVVHPSVPTRTIPELIAYAKANPGRINMASAGNGTTSHLAGEMFKMSRHRHSARALSRRGACLNRLACRPGAGVLPPNGLADRAGQGGQAASTRGDDRHPLGGAAGHSDRGRVRAGL